MSAIHTTARQAAAPKLVLDAVGAALSHPGRRAILELLACHGPLSPGEIAQAFPAARRTTVSRQLTVLRHAGLLSVARRTRQVIHAGDSPEARALKLLDQAGPGSALLYTLRREPLALLGLWLQARIWPEGSAPDTPEPPAAGYSQEETPRP